MDTIRSLIQKIERLKKHEKFNEAIELLQDSISKFDDYRLYEEMADIYLYQGKNLKAKKAIDFSLKMNPDSATGNYLKGFILLASNKAEKAIEFLEKSNSLMPNNAEILRNLGWAYVMIGERQKGISLLKRGLNLAPNDELIIKDLAMALIEDGKIKEGDELLSRLLKEKIEI